MKSSPAQTPRAPDARERILAAAERLFVLKGVEKTSSRDIVGAAEVNIAAINYYFRSKEGLAEELFVRLAERVTRMRLEDLSAYLESVRTMGAPVDIEPLVACFLRPYIESTEMGSLFARFVLEHRLAPTPMTTRVYDQYLDPFAHEFIDALCLVDERVPRTEWVWRYTLMTGTLVMAITDINAGNRLIALSNGQANAARREELGKHLLRFMCAALRA